MKRLTRQSLFPGRPVASATRASTSYSWRRTTSVINAPSCHRRRHLRAAGPAALDDAESPAGSSRPAPSRLSAGARQGPCNRSIAGRAGACPAGEAARARRVFLGLRSRAEQMLIALVPGSTPPMGRPGLETSERSPKERIALKPGTISQFAGVMTHAGSGVGNTTRSLLLQDIPLVVQPGMYHVFGDV